jgi:hypothetical protein
MHVYDVNDMSSNASNMIMRFIYSMQMNHIVLAATADNFNDPEILRDIFSLAKVEE